MRSIGRAPYFSTFASDCAVACVKLPVICAELPGIGKSTLGADTTRPSSTMAN